jgi:hypothetical protein
MHHAARFFHRRREVPRAIRPDGRCDVQASRRLDLGEPFRVAFSPEARLEFGEDTEHVQKALALLRVDRE